MPEKTVAVGLEARVAGFIAGMKSAQASVSSLTRELDKSAARKQAWLTIGNVAGGIGLAAAAGVGVAVKAAADFDKAMSSVEAATRAPTGAMEQLRAAAMKAGADTAFSATEAAGGIENLAKAGVSTNDILRGGLMGALNLAAAGQIDVADAAESAATAMTQFGLQGRDVPHVADLLAAAAGKAQGEVGDFSMALNQSGLVANQTGLSIEETTGALAAFASQGLIGSDAGTSLKTALQSLTPSSTKAKEMMEELGISAYDSQGNFIGLSKYAGVLRDKLSGMSAEQRNATLKTIFGSDAVRAATVLYDEGADGIQRWINKVNDQGFAAETAATKMDNLAGDFEQLKGSLETALIGTGESGQGPLRALTQGATNAVNAYNKLPGPVKEATLAFGGLVAVTGGATFLGARFLTSVAEAKVAMAELKISANTAKTAMRGIGKGITFAATLYGIHKIDDAMDAIFHERLDQSGLQKDLVALGKTGQMTGNLLETFGGDVGGIATDVGKLDAGLVSTKYGIQGLTDAMVGWMPGTTGLEASEERVTNLDHALADLVRGGNAQMAKTVFNQIAAAAKQQGIDIDVLREKLPGYSRALDDANAANRKTASSTNRSADAVEDETTALEDNIRAHNNRNDALLEGIDKNIAWNQSVDDAAKEARQGTKTLNVNTQAGRDNLQALADMAGAWNDLPDKTKRAEGGIKSARQEFIRIAEQMGADKQQAHELARELLDIPNPHREVTVDTQGARQEVSDFVRDLASKLTGIKDESVRISLATSAESILNTAKGLDIFHAEGGPITGGVRGRDSVPAVLMPGEHVFTTSDVEKAGGHRAMFAIRKMIQSGEFARKGDLQYFSQGGPVVRPQVQGMGAAAATHIAAMYADAMAAEVGRAMSGKLNKALRTTSSGVPLGTGGSLSAGQIVRGQHFAQSQAGLPYQWGGTGNPSWDCSGFVGGVLLAALGRNPRQRIGSTASMPWPGFSPGTGTFTTGTDPGSHMDGNIGGLGIESRGGDGVTLGSGITPIGSFARIDHFDQGGPLHPGWTLAYNGTGRDEYVHRFYGGSQGGGSYVRQRGPVRVVVDMGGQTFRGMMYDAAEEVVSGNERHRARIGAM